MIVLCTVGLDNRLTEGITYKTTGLDKYGQIPVVGDDCRLVYYQSWHFEDEENGVVYGCYKTNLPLTDECGACKCLECEADCIMCEYRKFCLRGEGE